MREMQVLRMSITWILMLNFKYEVLASDNDFGEVYNELLEAGVPFVPAIFCQGDVIQSTFDADEAKTGPSSCERVSFACIKPFTSILGQRSLTDRYQTASWNCHKVVGPPITPHIHYRLALVEVGYPLKNLVGTKELMHATHNAFSG